MNWSRLLIRAAKALTDRRSSRIFPPAQTRRAAVRYLSQRSENQGLSVRDRPLDDLRYLPEWFVVFDLETTGLNPDRNRIIEIGAVRVERDASDHVTFQAFIKHKQPVPPTITRLTGITTEMTASGVALKQALTEFREFVGGLPLVAFNAPFDMGFLRAACRTTTTPAFDNEVCCALSLARRAWPHLRSHRLSVLSELGNLSNHDAHRALGDCRRTITIYSAASSIVRARK